MITLTWKQADTNGQPTIAEAYLIEYRAQGSIIIHQIEVPSSDITYTPDGRLRAEIADLPPDAYQFKVYAKQGNFTRLSP